MSDFQWIFDKAESLSINRKKMVAVTTARDGSTRSVSRGTMPYRFTVKVPDGLAWSEIKDLILAAEALDKISTAEVSIGTSNTTGYGWYYNSTTVPFSPDTYIVRCIEFPEWTISQRNIVTWSGPFVFVEDFS
jgi:hypothetical protein